MLELGEHAARRASRGLLRVAAAAGPRRSFSGLGPHLRGAGPDNPGRRRLGGARGSAERDELIDALKRDLRPGDQVFFKGSHGFGLEHVAQAIAPGGENREWERRIVDGSIFPGMISL